jgi:hypothetical protein
MRFLTFTSTLAVLACSAASVLAAPATNESATPHICGLEGAFGIRFGDRVSSTHVPAHTFFFGRGCYQVTPAVTHAGFDTYAACVSEFDGKVFQIQAIKVFDDQPAKGSLSLTPAQRESNRQRGRQALTDLLAQVPPEISAKANIPNGSRAWELPIAEGVVLEVSNQPEWAVTLECRNDAMTQDVFRQRIRAKR